MISPLKPAYPSKYLKLAKIISHPHLACCQLLANPQVIKHRVAEISSCSDFPIKTFIYRGFHGISHCHVWVHKTTPVEKARTYTSYISHCQFWIRGKTTAGLVIFPTKWQRKFEITSNQPKSCRGRGKWAKPPNKLRGVISGMFNCKFSKQTNPMIKNWGQWFSVSGYGQKYVCSMLIVGIGVCNSASAGSSTSTYPEMIQKLTQVRFYMPKDRGSQVRWSLLIPKFDD